MEHKRIFRSVECKLSWRAITGRHLCAGVSRDSATLVVDLIGLEKDLMHQLLVCPAGG